jgi:DNA-binding MarR family transcriptional regulator
VNLVSIEYSDRGKHEIVGTADPGTNVNVTISIGDIRVQFNGSSDSVISSVISFLTKQIPALDLANRISLNYTITELIQSYSDIIKITPEGPRIIPILDGVELRKLSDKQIVALQLIASRIAKGIGRIEDDRLRMSDLQSATGLKSKSISSRLSELVKVGYVQRDVVRDGGELPAYRITTAGINWLNSMLAKRKKIQGMD